MMDTTFINIFRRLPFRTDDLIHYMNLKYLFINGILRVILEYQGLTCSWAQNSLKQIQDAYGFARMLYKSDTSTRDVGSVRVTVW